MRSVWINEGDELDAPRVRQFGITRVYWSERTHTKAHVDYARAQGFEVGIYSNPQWYGFPAPKVYRDRLNQRVTELGGNTAQLAVQVNYEVHDAAWLMEFFYWWRRVRANRETSWTLEGFQGGWAEVAILHPNLAGVEIVPQCYSGSMEPWDSAAVVKDLVDWGVPFSRVAPFIDAKDANRRGWYGFAYMAHRLPA